MQDDQTEFLSKNRLREKQNWNLCIAHFSPLLKAHSAQEVNQGHTRQKHIRQMQCEFC